MGLGRMTVVILAQQADSPVDALVRQLTARNVPLFRADTRWFPRQMVLDARLNDDGRWTGQLSTAHRAVDLMDPPRTRSLPRQTSFSQPASPIRRRPEQHTSSVRWPAAAQLAADVRSDPPRDHDRVAQLVITAYPAGSGRGACLRTGYGQTRHPAHGGILSTRAIKSLPA